MHWMAEGDPEAVKDKDVRTKVFDWKVPLEVDGRRGAIAGTLFWTPVPSSGLPLGAIIAFAALVIALVRRGDRRPPPPRGARGGAGGLVIRALAVALAALALLPATAGAHATLEATTPERGARLKPCPSR